MGGRRNWPVGEGRFASMGTTGDTRLSRRYRKKFYDVMARWFGIQRHFASIQVKKFYIFSKNYHTKFFYVLIFRPDLINWREIRSRLDTRQRLERAFVTAEREFGVTRLLDPEGRRFLPLNLYSASKNFI